MKLLGLDIPDGLEALFAKIFQPAVAGSTDIVQTKKNLANVRVYKYLNSQSLFVRWQSLYDGFDFSRKSAWTAYWLTLPFGDHSGGSGWPGSGFSAFVYLNAPRFKANEDLLLDPPLLTGDLIVDGDFALGNFDNWSFENYIDAWNFVSGKANHFGGGIDDALLFDNALYWDGENPPHFGPGSGIWGVSPASVRLAQRYVPPADQTVGVVALGVYPSGDGGDSFYCEVRQGGTLPSDGSVIATSDNWPGNHNIAFGQLSHFHFSTPLSLTSGTVYWFVVRQDPEPYVGGTAPAQTYLQYVDSDTLHIADYYKTTAISPESWSHLAHLALLMRLAEHDFDNQTLAQSFSFAEHLDYQLTVSVGGTKGRVRIEINGYLLDTVEAGTGSWSFVIPDGDGDFRLLSYTEDFGNNSISIQPSWDFDGTIDNVHCAPADGPFFVPALGDELLVNGDFDGNSDGWETYNFSYRDHSVAADSGDFDNSLLAPLNVKPWWQAGTYTLSYNIGSGSGEVDVYIFNQETAEFISLGTHAGGDGDVSDDFVGDFLAHDQPTEFKVYFNTENADVEISNVSFKRTA